MRPIPETGPIVRCQPLYFILDKPEKVLNVQNTGLVLILLLSMFVCSINTVYCVCVYCCVLCMCVLLCIVYVCTAVFCLCVYYCVPEQGEALRWPSGCQSKRLLFPEFPACRTAGRPGPGGGPGWIHRCDDRLHLLLSSASHQPPAPPPLAAPPSPPASLPGFLQRWVEEPLVFLRGWVEEPQVSLRRWVEDPQVSPRQWVEEPPVSLQRWEGGGGGGGGGLRSSQLVICFNSAI